MLHVTYEADHLDPGRLARVVEDRGTIRIAMDAEAPLAAVLRQLNIEVEQLMATSHWFQLWKDEIISRATPHCSLRVEYLLDLREPGGIEITERKGLVRVHVDPALTTREFIAVMNPLTQEFLDAGQWFQLYAGEIIDSSPEPVSQV